jgi:hypothetical protein
MKISKFLIIIFIFFYFNNFIYSDIILPIYKSSYKKISFQKRDWFEVLPIEGNITKKAFYTKISIGTPPQIFYVQLDTGSSDFAIYSSSCDCGTNEFKTSNSTTFQPIYCGSSPCTFNINYADGSYINGYIGKDVLSIANLKTTIEFGIINSASPSFEIDGIDGIWGLAFKSLSQISSSLPTVFDTLVQNKLIEDIFSLCLLESGATLSLGFNNSNNQLFQWTPILKYNNNYYAYYQVGIMGIYVNGSSLNLESSSYNRTIVDSGTNVLVLPLIVYNAFQTLYKNYCSNINMSVYCENLLNGNSVTLTQYEIRNLPSIEIYLNGSVTLNISAENYLINEQGSYKLGIISQNNDGTILGDVVLSSYHVVFDRVNYQIGFGSIATCPTSTTSSYINKAICKNLDFFIIYFILSLILFI